MRSFDPATVQNGHIYSSIKDEKVFIHWAQPQYMNEAEDFVGGFDNHLQLDNQQRNIVFGISKVSFSH